MGRERIQLRGHSTTARLRWAAGNQASHDYVTITVGQLLDGRWFLDANRNPDGALVCADQRDAVSLAQTWMTRSGRDWQPYPPAFKSISEPVDPEWRSKHDELVHAAGVDPGRQVTPGHGRPGGSPDRG